MATTLSFDDRDPGWTGILQDLPPKLPRSVLLRMLRKRRRDRMAGHMVIPISSDSGSEAIPNDHSPAYSPLLSLF